MKVAAVKTSELPVCLAIYSVKVDVYISAIDVKWHAAFPMMSADILEAAAPSISRDEVCAAQLSMSMGVLTDFVRHHSQKKTEESVFKEKLVEVLRGFKSSCISQDVEMVCNRVMIMLHPKQYAPGEIATALQDLQNAAATNSFVKALVNLPPSEAWFVTARTLGEAASKENSSVVRFSEFLKRDAVTAVMELVKKERDLDEGIVPSPRPRSIGFPGPPNV